eukprot:7688839-Alexandrium_andersonii.AAC.1
MADCLTLAATRRTHRLPWAMHTTGPCPRNIHRPPQVNTRRAWVLEARCCTVATHTRARAAPWSAISTSAA